MCEPIEERRSASERHQTIPFKTGKILKTTSPELVRLYNSKNNSCWMKTCRSVAPPRSSTLLHTTKIINLKFYYCSSYYYTMIYVLIIQISPRDSSSGIWIHRFETSRAGMTCCRCFCKTESMTESNVQIIMWIVVFSFQNNYKKNNETVLKRRRLCSEFY